jgi:hypothetical protein
LVCWDMAPHSSCSLPPYFSMCSCSLPPYFSMCYLSQWLRALKRECFIWPPWMYRKVCRWKPIGLPPNEINTPSIF